MTKYHLMAVAVGIVIGVAAYPKLKGLPLVNKIPTVG